MTDGDVSFGHGVIPVMMECRGLAPGMQGYPARPLSEEDHTYGFVSALISGGHRACPERLVGREGGIPCNLGL